MITEDKSQAVQFLLTEFEGALSRHAMNRQSEENLLNIHLTLVALAGGGFATLWISTNNALAASITIIGLLLLFTIGLTIERRVINHVMAIKWDSYRYRLIQQFFLDKYPESDISSYIEWPQKPEDALVIHRGSFARSSIAISATVNSVILVGAIYFMMAQINFQTWFAVVMAVILGGSSLLLHRMYFHGEAKLQGMTLALTEDVRIVRQPRTGNNQSKIAETLDQKK